MDDPFFANLAAALARRVPGPPHPWRAQMVELFGAPLRPAGVLVPLFRDRDSDLRAVFTQRAASLPSHAGQVSFPGGSPLPGESSLETTALREAQEEIGLDPRACRVLGQLDPIPLPSGFEMTPVVAKIPAGYPFTPAAAEVQRIFSLSLRGLQDPATLEAVPREVRGQRVEVLYYRLDGEVVWGGTARILQLLLTVAGPLL